jgi:hypothetical protein
MKKIILIFCLLAFIVSCGGRLPSSKRAGAIVRNHFNHYGHKYKGTVYYKNPTKDVEILSMEELHKGLVSAEAFITLQDDTLKKVLVTIEKGPFGWRYKSWEALIQ